jgi:hypothetical protein
MTPFSTRDMISVRCNLKNRKDVILRSIYMGHEPNRPEIEPTTLLKFAKLVDFSKTTVANKGKNPTFVNSRGHKSIIDITLTNKMETK